MKLWWTSQNHMKSWKKSKSYEIIIRFLRICKNWRKLWATKRRRRLQRTTESSASANCAGTNFISIQKCSNTNLQQAMSRLSRPGGPHAQVNKKLQMKRPHAQVNKERPINIARGTTDPEIDSVTWIKFSNNMAPLAFVANLATRWRHLQ